MNLADVPDIPDTVVEVDAPDQKCDVCPYKLAMEGEPKCLLVTTGEVQLYVHDRCVQYFPRVWYSDENNTYYNIAREYDAYKKTKCKACSKVCASLPCIGCLNHKGKSKRYHGMYKTSHMYTLTQQYIDHYGQQHTSQQHPLHTTCGVTKCTHMILSVDLLKIVIDFNMY